MTAKWRENTELAIKSLAVISLGFGIWKYLADRADGRLLDRKLASADLVEAYDAEIAERVEDIEFALSPYIAVRGVEAFVSNSPKRALDEELSDIFDVLYFGIGAPETQPLAPSWFDVLRFYDSASTCISLGVCDAEYLQGFLCDRAVDFLSFQEVFIQYYNSDFNLKRPTSLVVGAGLRNIVDLCLAPEPT